MIMICFILFHFITFAFGQDSMDSIDTGTRNKQPNQVLSQLTFFLAGCAATAFLSFMAYSKSSHFEACVHFPTSNSHSSYN